MNPLDFLVHNMMMPLLGIFHGITHSYGLAIILLTLLVRGAIFPLSMKQYASMKSMQELQPKMKELQAKYKDNPQELNQAMMAFYQENKVNPFGGCLPMLIQMPFLIALYSTLMSPVFSLQVNHEGFLFIRDLTQVGFHTGWHAPLLYAENAGVFHWDNIAMLIFFGVTTFITQKMMQTDPNDQMQRQMLYMMPVMITGMFLVIPLPSGVLLYTVVSNLFTMAQYMVLKRKYPSPKPAVAGGATIDVAAQPAGGADKKKGK